jgi:hypothetical protein
MAAGRDPHADDGHLGFGTTSDVLPGIMIVLVPLPLLMSIPGTAEPGIVTICGDPGLPVTSPAPREVVTPGVGAMLGIGAATTAGGGAMVPPEGGICAWAEPVSAARTVAETKNLIISHAPETGQGGPSDWRIWGHVHAEKVARGNICQSCLRCRPTRC